MPKLTTDTTDPAAQSKQTCKTCRFWDPLDRPPHEPPPGTSPAGPPGSCRRLSPRIVLGLSPALLASLYHRALDEGDIGYARMKAAEAVWPVTGEDGWCGEWE